MTTTTSDRSQLRDSGGMSRAPRSLRARAERLRLRDITFIRHPGFARLKPESIELPKGPMVRDEPEVRSPQTVLSPLFRSPVLRPEIETLLFRRMNYLKYRATRLRRQLDSGRPRRSLVEGIEAHLREAETCRAILVQSNLRLVAATARKFNGSVVDFEELLCEGNVVLLHAVDKFDFSRGFRFSTYAVNALQRHLYRVIGRRQRQLQRESPGDVDLFERFGPSMEPASPSFPVLTRETIDAWVRRLDPRSRAILLKRFDLKGTGETKTLSSIAAEIGVSKEMVRQVQIRALAELRRCVPESVATADAWDFVIS